jgi:murein DD-endopeptidase MepM/ murein hydrolase activator NlpD
LVIAAVVTASLTLTGGTPDPDIPIDNTPVTMRNPLDEFTVGKEFADDRLLWCPTLKLYETNLGIDFEADMGAKVHAVLDGTVESVSVSALEGIVIVINHGEGVRSIYKSLAENTEVTTGQAVKRGDVIGYVGNTMITKVKQGPLLHFAVTVNGNFVNPALHLPDLIEK